MTDWTGYNNQGFAAFIQGIAATDNPWVKTCAAHAEWTTGHETARARHALGENATTAPLPLYTVKDVATASIDPRGFKVTFARLGAQFSKQSAEDHAAKIITMGRLATVVEITPAEQLQVIAGQWDGYAKTSDIDAEVTKEMAAA